MIGETSVLVAFAAGLLSFVSPCVLPLIPSYLSFISGANYQELSAGSADRRVIMWRTTFFVIGFSIVFVALGILFSQSGLLFSNVGRWINIVAGAIVVFLGLNTLFNFVATLNAERRVQLTRRPASAVGAAAVGMAFGAGWSPCIGPILAGILFLAGSSGDVGQAAFLLGVYSLGLGLPFLIAGFAFTRTSAVLDRLKRHMGAIKTVSGVFLILVGLMIAFGRFQRLTGLITGSGYRLARWSAAEPVLANVVFTTLFVALAALGPALRLIKRKSMFTPINAAFGIVMLSTAAAGLAGALDIGGLLGAWLSFEGI